MNSGIGFYTKAILAAFIAAGTAAITALQDGSIGSTEWVAIAGAFIVAAGAVWAVPNVPESVRVYGKAITAGVIAALASLTIGLSDGGGLSAAEWITLLIALISGSGLVALAPNASASDNLIQYLDDDIEGEVVEGGSYDPTLLPPDPYPGDEPTGRTIDH